MAIRQEISKELDEFIINHFKYDNGDLLKLDIRSNEFKKCYSIQNVNEKDKGYLSVDFSFNKEKYGFLQHIIIWRLCKNKWPDDNMVIDHANKNSIDNRIENLREATQSQNALNSGWKKNAAGYRGVYEHKHKYIKQYEFNGKVTITTPTKEIAEKIRDLFLPFCFGDNWDEIKYTELEQYEIDFFNNHCRYDNGKLFMTTDHYKNEFECKCVEGGYIRTRPKLNGELHSYFAHQIIYYLHHKCMPTVIDHKDTNRLNNKIENLRAANNMLNSQNMKSNQGSYRIKKSYNKYKLTIPIKASPNKIEIAKKVDAVWYFARPFDREFIQFNFSLEENEFIQQEIKDNKYNLKSVEEILKNV